MNPRKTVPFRKFSVHCPIDGLEVKVGANVNTPATALRRAAQLSQQYGYATVLDNSKSIHSRMVALFKRGIESYNALSEI